MMDSSPEISESKSNSTPSTLSSGPLQLQLLNGSLPGLLIEVASEESPVFSYISNLSPINPDKAAPVAQGFPGINSPPLVFRSPQINLNSQPTFLRRPQFSGSLDARLSGQDESFEATVTVTEESGISSSHLSSGLRTCPEEELVTDNSPPKKASSPLGCADDYLSENVMMAGGDSASLTNLTSKNSGVFFQSQTDLLDSKEIVDKTEDKDKDDPRKDGMKMEASPEILVQAEEDYQKNPLSDLKSFEPNHNSGDGNTPPEICSKAELDTSVDHALDNQHKDKNAGSGHLFEVGSTSLLKSLQMAEDCGSFRENAGGPYSEAVKNKMHDHSPKVVQHQHGISRRLQFEDTQNKITANIDFQNSSESADYPSLPASPSDSEVIESASLDKPTSPNKRLLDNMTLPMFPFQNDNVKVSKRSGIGLHLNSIVNSMQMGSGATMVSMKSVERGTFGGLGNKSIPITSCHLSKKCSNSSNVECVSMSSNDSRHDTHPSIAASSVSLSPYSMKPLYEAVVLKPVELQSTLSNKRMSNSETSDSYEDFGQSSPRKKRKKTLDAGDSNGCKRCNCKKTKCLKLYCDCFAAGIYCAEPCACQGCFNRPEYEDTVLETRQQIESRNPLAFAPKIVQHVTEPPTNIYADDGGHFTPSSARHKRGCNCKKSKCLKKYCECYHANVGCSDGCRCEACENVYGRKGEYGIVKGLVSKQDNSETRDSTFDMTLETVEPKYGLLHSELYKAHSLTPLTPSFQCSDHGKGGSKASGRYHPSPESGLTFIAPCGKFPGQATNDDIHDMILETNPEILDLVSFDQDLGYGNGHTMNKFSPSCDVPSNAGHLTALPNPQDWANTSRAQMFPRNCQVSSASSLRWRSSPITPSTNFGETKLHEAVDFDGGLFSIMDDDTPEILKDTPMPTNGVKVSSPNKKRISPPHGRGTKLGSSSSAGLRTGRKFILQAVPSFPPLTPCIKSKAGSSQNTSNSQNSSSSK